MTGTSEHIWASMATVALGATIQGILGFGCSLVWMSFFPLFTTIVDAVGVLQPLAIGLNALLLQQLWKHASLKDLKPLALAAPIGVLFGLWVVKSWPSHAINGLLGIFLLLYVTNTCKDNVASSENKADIPTKRRDIDNDDEAIAIIKDEKAIELPSSIPPEASMSEELQNLRQPDENEKKNKIVVETISDDDDDSIVKKDDDGLKIKPPSTASSCVALPAGFVGGCLASVFGTAGPAILVYAREVGWDNKPEKFRANLQVVFFALNVLAITSQTLSGIINLQTLQVTIQLIPALYLGGLVGAKLASKVRKDIFRLLVLCGMAIMGVVFLSKAFQ